MGIGWLAMAGRMHAFIPLKQDVAHHLVHKGLEELLCAWWRIAYVGRGLVSGEVPGSSDLAKMPSSLAGGRLVHDQLQCQV